MWVNRRVHPHTCQGLSRWGSAGQVLSPLPVADLLLVVERVGLDHHVVAVRTDVDAEGRDHPDLDVLPFDSGQAEAVRRLGRRPLREGAAVDADLARVVLQRRALVRDVVGRDVRTAQVVVRPSTSR